MVRQPSGRAFAASPRGLADVLRIPSMIPSRRAIHSRRAPMSRWIPTISRRRDMCEATMARTMETVGIRIWSAGGITWILPRHSIAAGGVSHVAVGRLARPFGPRCRPEGWRSLAGTQRTSFHPPCGGRCRCEHRRSRRQRSRRREIGDQAVSPDVVSSPLSPSARKSKKGAKQRCQGVTRAHCDRG